MNKEEFPQGLIIKKPDNAPDFVIAKMSIKKDEFIKYLHDQDGEWVNFDLLNSKQGKPYAKINTWKPQGNKDDLRF